MISSTPVAVPETAFSPGSSTQVSRNNVALGLHNTARRGDRVLDEHLATVCRLHDGRIVEIETFLSDLPGMNAFFAVEG